MTLSTGETLLLYTDGLIERRGRQLSDGEMALEEVAASAPDEPELMCQEITSQLTEGIAIADDHDIVAAGHHAAGGGGVVHAVRDLFEFVGFAGCHRVRRL